METKNGSCYPEDNFVVKLQALFRLLGELSIENFEIIRWGYINVSPEAIEAIKDDGETLVTDKALEQCLAEDHRPETESKYRLFFQFLTEIPLKDFNIISWAYTNVSPEIFE